MKTNVQPSGQEQRIYTSTPIFKKQSKSGQRTDAIGLCSFAKATAKQYFCVGNANGVKGQESVINILKALLAVVILVIVYKTIILAMSYINGSDVQQLSSYVQAQLSGAFKKLLPVLCGLLVAGFGYAIVYLDSAAPGVSPPTPLSPRAKQWSSNNKSSMQLNYFCALAVGIIVTFFTYSHL